MVKANLEKELKSGIASFTAYGKVKITPETFPLEDSQSQSGWVYRRASFPIQMGETNSIYVQMMGGHHANNGVIYGVPRKEGKSQDVAWSLRNDPDVLESIADYAFLRARIEKDEQGNVIEKKFLSELDLIDYLASHLENETEVYVSGQVEYQRYKGKVQRSFNVRTIGLNENNHEAGATMRQTYLVDDMSLARGWERELAKDGKTVINAYVPQYVSKENGKSIKQVLAFPQQIVFKSSEEDLEKRSKALKKFFKPAKNVVREMALVCELYRGYEKVTGQVEFSDRVKDIIWGGFESEESIKNTPMVTGTLVDETVFKTIMLKQLDDGSIDVRVADRYAPEALIIRGDDEDIEKSTDANAVFSTDNTNDPFSDDNLFGNGD